MLDTETLPQGGEGAAAPEITDERSAATAIEGLLDFGDDTSGDDVGHTESGASAPDAGPDESRTAGEGDEGHTEPQEQAPATVEPPASWSAEEKAAFSKLPPDLQATVARRESEQQATFTKRTQETAELRKAVEAEQQAVQAQRNAHITALQQLAQIVVPDLKALEFLDGPEGAQLAATQPGEWARLTAQRDALRGRFRAIQTEHQRAEAERAADSDKRMQGMLAEQRQKLVERVPEFADAAKATKLTADLGQHLQSAYGFSPQEIGQTVDHRLVMVGLDAMKWRQHEAALKTAETKRQNTPPKVQSAGSPQGSDATAARAVQERRAKLGKTGSVRDAASLFELALNL